MLGVKNQHYVLLCHNGFFYFYLETGKCGEYIGCKYAITNVQGCYYKYLFKIRIILYKIRKKGGFMQKKLNIRKWELQRRLLLGRNKP